MRTTTLALALFLAAAAAVAQETETPVAPTADYSRDTLLRLMENDPDRPEVEPNVRWGFGSVHFRAFGGTRVRLSWLPFLSPLPGSVPTTTYEWPDAFALTGTEIAATPRTYRQRRDLNSEQRRIDRLMEGRTSVTVSRED